MSLERIRQRRRRRRWTAGTCLLVASALACSGTARTTESFQFESFRNSQNDARQTGTRNLENNVFKIADEFLPSQADEVEDEEEPTELEELNVTPLPSGVTPITEPEPLPVLTEAPSPSTGAFPPPTSPPSTPPLTESPSMSPTVTPTARPTLTLGGPFPREPSSFPTSTSEPTSTPTFLQPTQQPTIQPTFPESSTLAPTALVAPSTSLPTTIDPSPPFPPTSAPSPSTPEPSTRVPTTQKPSASSLTPAPQKPVPVQSALPPFDLELLVVGEVDMEQLTDSTDEALTGYLTELLTEELGDKAETVAVDLTVTPKTRRRRRLGRSPRALSKQSSGIQLARFLQVAVNEVDFSVTGTALVSSSDGGVNEEEFQQTVDDAVASAVNNVNEEEFLEYARENTEGFDNVAGASAEIQNDNNGSDTPSIVAIVFGSLIVLLLVVMTGFYGYVLWKKRKKRIEKRNRQKVLASQRQGRGDSSSKSRGVVSSFLSRTPVTAPQNDDESSGELSGTINSESSGEDDFARELKWAASLDRRVWEEHQNKQQETQDPGLLIARYPPIEPHAQQRILQKGSSDGDAGYYDVAQSPGLIGGVHPIQEEAGATVYGSPTSQETRGGVGGLAIRSFPYGDEEMEKDQGVEWTTSGPVSDTTPDDTSRGGSRNEPLAEKQRELPTLNRRFSNPFASVAAPAGAHEAPDNNGNTNSSSSGLSSEAVLPNGTDGSIVIGSPTKDEHSNDSESLLTSEIVREVQLLSRFVKRYERRREKQEKKRNESDQEKGRGIDAALSAPPMGYDNLSDDSTSEQKTVPIGSAVVPDIKAQAAPRAILNDSTDDSSASLDESSIFSSGSSDSGTPEASEISDESRLGISPFKVQKPPTQPSSTSYAKPEVGVPRSVGSPEPAFSAVKAYASALFGREPRKAAAPEESGIEESEAPLSPESTDSKRFSMSLRELEMSLQQPSLSMNTTLSDLRQNEAILDTTNSDANWPSSPTSGSGANSETPELQSPYSVPSARHHQKDLGLPRSLAQPKKHESHVADRLQFVEVPASDPESSESVPPVDEATRINGRVRFVETPPSSVGTSEFQSTFIIPTRPEGERTKFTNLAENTPSAMKDHRLQDKFTIPAATPASQGGVPPARGIDREDRGSDPGDTTQPKTVASKSEEATRSNKTPSPATSGNTPLKKDAPVSTAESPRPRRPPPRTGARNKGFSSIISSFEAKPKNSIFPPGEGWQYNY